MNNNPAVFFIPVGLLIALAAVLSWPTNSEQSNWTIFYRVMIIIAAAAIAAMIFLSTQGVK